MIEQHDDHENDENSNDSEITITHDDRSKTMRIPTSDAGEKQLANNPNEQPTPEKLYTAIQPKSERQYERPYSIMMEQHDDHNNDENSNDSEIIITHDTIV